MTLLILSFIAGILTVLAPCILPFVPVIIGGSIQSAGQTKSRERTVVVISSLAVSLITFTFLLKVSTLFVFVPEQFWKYLSGGIIGVMGLVTLFPKTWESISFIRKVNQRSNVTLGSGMKKGNFIGDVMVGGALGPVFATCSPTYFVVLATVLPVSLFLGFVYILTYTLGLCLALLSISLFGQSIVEKLGIVANPHGMFKRVLGLVFVLVGLAVITGYDKKIEVYILERGYFDVTRLENFLLEREGVKDGNTNSTQGNVIKEEAPTIMPAVSNELQSSDVPEEQNPPKVIPQDLQINTSRAISSSKNIMNFREKQKKYLLAPDISGASGYVNTEEKPITISEFKGKKVVLVDIWTYGCINCQHTLPYLTSWYQKYKEQGLEIIGIHTPEVSYERVKSNVVDATKRFGITYPVVLDNDYQTWAAFQNKYWPRVFLVDIDGFIIYDHIGEGEYDTIETKIIEALTERSNRLNN